MSPCQLFQYIAENVWDEIVNNHPFGNRLHEEGLTRQTVIGRIQRYTRDRNLFQVFAQKARDEVNRGADLEIFIQKDYSSFYRILLQAKLVEEEGYFDNLDRQAGSTGNRQYDQLINYGNTINCPTFYLIYNGIAGFQGSFSDCYGSHNEKQFGCAIIDSTVIKNHCENNNTGRLQGLTGNRPQGDPWRFLTCCDEMFNIDSYSSFTSKEIDMDPSFERIFTDPDPIGFITRDGLGGAPESDISKKNRTITENGWEPAARIFLSDYKMRFRNEKLRF